MKFRVTSKGENETKQIAKTIASLFNSGDLIILDGDLGTGKTHFVKGFADGLCSQNLVTSPTFSIANFYNSATAQLLHIDLYRINTFDEFNDIGLYDYFSQSIVIIEWGLKFSEYFDEYFLISLAYDANETDTRKITFDCKGEKYNSIMNTLNQKLPNLLPC